MLDHEEVERLGDTVLSPLVKGMPTRAAGLRLRDLGLQGWNILEEDLPLPLVTLRRSALEHNIGQMRSYCTAHGVDLAPHGKTTMAPQIFKLQFEAGCWAMTAATAEQLQVYRHFGVRRILFANELAGRANTEIVARLIQEGEWEMTCFVDSVEAVEELIESSRSTGMKAPFRVLIEVGYQGGRSGLRDLTQLLPVARAIQGSDGRVELAGVSGFEGLLPIDRSEESQSAIHGYIRTVGEAVDALAEHLPASFIVTAGGSSAFDHVVEELSGRWRGAHVVLRSGCYVTHDHNMYARSSPLRSGPAALLPALELWSYVNSVPEPGLALLTFGRRDAPFDYGFPVPIKYARKGSRSLLPLEGARIRAMNDQHGHLELPPNLRLHVGDRVVLGISHPCTAFDKWKLIPVVDDDETVVDGILTFF